MMKLFKRLAMVNELGKAKTFVFIVSSMRSGSTLLKSLLSNAPDTSHLPEVNFQKYSNEKAKQMKLLSRSKIIILKKPAAFHDTTYPIIPNAKGSKKIVLVRDVYDTVLSIAKMNDDIDSTLNEEFTLEKLVNDYWYNTYSNILSAVDIKQDDVMLVKYEELVNNPMVVTKKVFQFIGSAQTNGVDSYKKPGSFEWKWGNDDGGDKIKSLQVQKKQLVRTNEELLKIIRNSPKVVKLSNEFGYSY